MFTNKLALAGMVAGLALAGGAAALAQPAPKPESGPPQADRRQAMMQRACADMPARLAGRLAYTEVKIGITEQQRAAWQTFATEARTAAQPLQRLCTERTAAARPATPPDAVMQLTRREQGLQAMLETTRGVRMALEKLMPVLTDDQKRQVAEIVAHLGHRPWGHRMAGHHRMMHRHGHGPGDVNAPPPTPQGQTR